MTAQKNYRTDSFVTEKAIKAPVILVTTANVATLSAAQTIETVVLAIGDRVLLNAQTDAKENGIWVVEQAAWNRAGDWDGSRDATNGSLIISTQGGSVVLWELQTSNDPFIPGTHNASFSMTNVSLTSTVRLAADLTETTTTIQSALGPITLKAGKFYQIEAHLVMHSSSLATAPNGAIKFSYSAAEVSKSGRIDFNDIAGFQSISAALTTQQSAITMKTGGVGDSVIVRAHHVLEATAAGDLDLGFAVGSGSSGSPVVTLKAGSYMIVRELP